MTPPNRSLLAAEAARHLGVSVKALKLYEQRGLLRPARSEAGYRRYGPEALRAARDVVALRALGLSLAQIEQALKGDVAAIDQALAAREAALGQQFIAMQRASHRLRELRQGLACGQMPPAGELGDALGETGAALSLELPWPWGGEAFTLAELSPLTYLVGPLGSGKTRLAELLAQTLPHGRFVGLQRLEDPTAFERGLALTEDETAAVAGHLDWLRDEGATELAPLRLLLSALEAKGGELALVIEMIEQGLSRASQEALMALLRWRLKSRAAPVVAMTRSSSILDLSRVGAGEAILFCPANHSLPFIVPPFAGAVGYEALASCLATPEVRERLAHPHC